MGWLAEIEKRAEVATEGPWHFGWADPADEPEHYAEALRQSVEHDRQKATSSTAWRVWSADEDDWLHLAFTGNGPTSKATSDFIAHSREDVPELIALCCQLGDALECAVEADMILATDQTESALLGNLMRALIAYREATT